MVARAGEKADDAKSFPSKAMAAFAEWLCSRRR